MRTPFFFSLALLLLVGPLLAGCSPSEEQRPSAEAKRAEEQMGPGLRIVGVEVEPLGRREEAGGRSHPFYTDTLRGRIAFEVRARTERVPIAYDSTVVAALEHNRTLAPGEEPIPMPPAANRVELEGAALIFGRPVVINGLEHPPGKNVLRDARHQHAIFFSLPSPGALSEIRLEEARFHVPRGWNTIRFRWQTDDGLTLGDTVRVFYEPLGHRGNSEGGLAVGHPRSGDALRSDTSAKPERRRPAALHPKTSSSTKASPSPMPSPQQYDSAPAMQIDPEKTYTATLQTSKGAIELELYPEHAPKTVNNFAFLAGEEFYDGTTFHRVIPNFMVQGGDPTGTGRGGPGYQFEDELEGNPLKHDSAGVLSMANAGPNTNGSQFFITHAAQPHLDGRHTVFGKVTEGQDIVDAIAQGDTLESVTVEEQ